MSDRPNQEPETLDDIADRLAANCPDTSAVLRRCAVAWRHDQRELADAQSDNSALQNRVNTAHRTLANAT